MSLSPEKMQRRLHRLARYAAYRINQDHDDDTAWAELVALKFGHALISEVRSAGRDDLFARARERRVPVTGEPIERPRAITPRRLRDLAHGVEADYPDVAVLARQLADCVAVVNAERERPLVEAGAL